MELQVMRGLLASLDLAADQREPTWDITNAIVGEARRLVAADNAAQARAAELRAEVMLEASSLGSPQAKAIIAQGEAQ